MSELLPMGWVETTLNEIATWGSGGTPKASEKKYYDGDIPWLIIADLNNGVVTTSKKKITKLGMEKSSTKWVELGSILLAMYGSIGKLGIAGIRCTTNQAIAFTNHIWGDIPNKFLFNYLKYQEPELLKIGQGGAQKNISQTILKLYPFPLPPLNEQKRIVVKLDKIMPRIDSLKAQLDRVPTIIKRFRQSVLTAAVTGKLTEKWREEHPGIESADRLLSILPNKLKDGYLNVFEETQYSDLPSNWIYAPLVNLGQIQGGGTPSKSNLNFWNGTIPWISPKDMKVDRISKGRNFISKNALEKSSTKLIPQNSILFVIRGMILAHTFPVAVTQNEVTINQDMKGITPYPATNPEYLFLVFKSIQGNVLSFIKEATHGTLRLEMSLLQTFAFPLPPLEEQKEIVRQVDKLFALADKLEAHYQKAKTHIDKLSQSILAKAFRGELVPQDPSDEPAKKLLERILAEKAKMESDKKKPGGRKQKTT